jgi:putative flippase GtrA
MVIGFIYILVLGWLVWRATGYKSGLDSFIGSVLAGMVIQAIFMLPLYYLLDVPQKTAATLAFGAAGLILLFVAHKRDATKEPV